MTLRNYNQRLEGAIKVAELRRKEMIDNGDHENAIKMDFHIAELLSLKQ